MNKRMFDNIKKSLSPSEKLIEDTKIKIMNNSTNGNHHISYKKLVACAACFVLLSAICIPTIFHFNSSIKTKSDSHIQNSVVSNDSEFKGVVVLAYSPKMSGQTASLESIENTIKTELKPNTQVLLPKYSLAMNSVPGLPFEFKILLSDDTKLNDYDMKIAVDNGSFLSWNRNTGKIIDNGKSYNGKSGVTLYWSPLDNDVATYDETKLVKKAEITVSVINNSNNVITQKIIITGEDGVFYAQVN